MIELELFIVFFTALFFTLIYVGTKGSTLWGILCYAAWQTFALMWLFIVPMSTSYLIAWLFEAVSMIFLLATIVGLLHSAGRLKPREHSDLD